VKVYWPLLGGTVKRWSYNKGCWVEKYDADKKTYYENDQGVEEWKFI